jgi:hypothetical protein
MICDVDVTGYNEEMKYVDTVDKVVKPVDIDVY